MRRLSSFVASVSLLWAASVLAQPAEPNQNVVRAEAPIVAGNALNAKQRALADAFRQATERAFAELLKQGEPLPSPWPPGVAQIKASLANSASKYVRSYRLIDQQTEGGVVKVMVEIDVDEVRLRREIDEARGEAAARARPAARPVANALVVAGPAPAGALVVKALGPEGVRAQLDPAVTEPQALVSAARQNALALFVAARSVAEAKVRGTSQVPVKCAIVWRLFLAGSQAGHGPVAQHTDEDYGFAANEAAARDACLGRVAATVARGVSTALRTPVTSAPFVTLQLQIDNVGVIPVLLQALRRMGAVMATEVRQVTGTQVEIRVFTRVGGAPLLQALGRELGGKLALVPVQPPSDIIVAKVQGAEVPLPSSEENR
jgi:hypothetical protein